MLTLLTLALLGASCSDSDDSTAQTASSTSTTVAPTSIAPTTTAAPTPTTEPGVDPGLAAKARAGVYRLGDFPSGWEELPPSPTDGLQIEALWKDLASCLGIDRSAPVEASSPTFRGSVAFSTVSTIQYTTESQAAAMADALEGPKSQDCFYSSFVANADRSRPPGATPGPPTITPLNVAPVGDRMIARRINITQNLETLQVFIFHDFYVIFKAGGAVVRTWFLKAGGGFPPTLERTLVETVVGRA